MTQKQDILNFLVDRSPKGFTSRQIFRKLDIKKFPSVRGRISELKKANKIKSRKSKFLKRLEYFVPKDDTIFTRKIVKGTLYRLSDPHRKGESLKKVFALTYEDNKINREKELLDAIEKKYKKMFIEFGYSDNKETRNPPHVWDFIEVGEE